MTYKDLKEILKQEFHSKNSGDIIESSRSLSERFKLNRRTVQKALDSLAEEEILVRGFNKRLYYRANVPSYLEEGNFTVTRDLLRMGKQYLTKILSIDVIPAESIAPIFQNETDIYRVQRLRIINETVCTYEINYLPKQKYPQLPEYLNNETSLYTLIKEHYKLHFLQGQDVLTIEPLTQAEIALSLGRPLGDKVVIAERKAYIKDTLYEYTKSYMKTEGFKFTFNLSNKYF